MLVLVTYDVSTVDSEGRRRLRRIARVCENYGRRVQKSVFECEVTREVYAKLRDALVNEIDSSEDSIRLYLLDRRAVDRIQHFGIGKPPEFLDEFVV